MQGARLAGVWSRRAEPAQRVRRRNSMRARCSTDFDALLANDRRALYRDACRTAIREYALRALAAGKPVLCEKPAAVNARTLQRMIDAARAANLLFMEAMKPPFYPLYRQLREHLQADPIGEIGLVRAGCSMANVPRDHPSFSFEAGGGALLDIGIYEVFLAVDWLGEALDVQTIGRLGATGVERLREPERAARARHRAIVLRTRSARQAAMRSSAARAAR